MRAHRGGPACGVRCGLPSAPNPSARTVQRRHWSLRTQRGWSWGKGRGGGHGGGARGNWRGTPKNSAPATSDADTPDTPAPRSLSPPPSLSLAGYDYGDVLGLSLLFYEAQRSGKLPPTNRVRWRNDSNLGDKAPNGADAEGGMHDAGDHLKINFPGAWSLGQLAWAAIEFKKGFALAGQTQHVKDVLRHVASYYVKCHYQDFGYVAMVRRGGTGRRGGGKGGGADRCVYPPSPRPPLFSPIRSAPKAPTTATGAAPRT